MPKLGSYSVVCVCACVCACVTEYDHSGVLDTVEKICSWTYILMYRLSADQMGGTTSTVDVTTNSMAGYTKIKVVVPHVGVVQMFCLNPEAFNVIA